MLIFLAACSEKNSGENHSQVGKTEQQEEKSKDLNEEIEDLDAERKAEPRQAPDSFPLPLPDGWVETTGANVFAVEETEEGILWVAEFSFDGDPKIEGEKYKKLIMDNGFSTYPGLASVGLDGFSFRMSGHIKGIEYMGTLQFGENDLYGDDGALPSSVHMAFKETEN